MAPRHGDQAIEFGAMLVTADKRYIERAEEIGSIMPLADFPLQTGH